MKKTLGEKIRTAKPHSLIPFVTQNEFGRDTVLSGVKLDINTDDSIFAATYDQIFLINQKNRSLKGVGIPFDATNTKKLYKRLYEESNHSEKIGSFSLDSIAYVRLLERKVYMKLDKTVPANLLSIYPLKPGTKEQILIQYSPVSSVKDGFGTWGSYEGIYVGEIHDGKPSGIGTLRSDFDEVTYTGYFDGGKFKSGICIAKAFIYDTLLFSITKQIDNKFNDVSANGQGMIVYNNMPRDRTSSHDKFYCGKFDGWDLNGKG